MDIVAILLALLLEGLADSAPGPEAHYRAREAISLAFIKALHRPGLPVHPQRRGRRDGGRGAESAVVDVLLAAFAQMTALATKFNDRPQEASRPFDSLRDGFVMGEGAGSLIFEEREHALRRAQTSTPR